MNATAKVNAKAQFTCLQAGGEGEVTANGRDVGSTINLEAELAQGERIQPVLSQQHNPRTGHVFRSQVTIADTELSAEQQNAIGRIDGFIDRDSENGLAVVIAEGDAADGRSRANGVIALELQQEGFSLRLGTGISQWELTRTDTIATQGKHHFTPASTRLPLGKLAGGADVDAREVCRHCTWNVEAGTGSQRGVGFIGSVWFTEANGQHQLVVGSDATAAIEVSNHRFWLAALEEQQAAVGTQVGAI